MGIYMYMYIIIIIKGLFLGPLPDSLVCRTLLNRRHATLKNWEGSGARHTCTCRIVKMRLSSSTSKQ